MEFNTGSEFGEYEVKRNEKKKTGRKTESLPVGEVMPSSVLPQA